MMPIKMIFIPSPVKGTWLEFLLVSFDTLFPFVNNKRLILSSHCKMLSNPYLQTFTINMYTKLNEEIKSRKNA